VSNLHLDVLAIDLGSVELGNGALGFVSVVHGDEGVALFGDVNVGDCSELAELILQ